MHCWSRSGTCSFQCHSFCKSLSETRELLWRPASSVAEETHPFLFLAAVRLSAVPLDKETCSDPFAWDAPGDGPLLLERMVVPVPLPPLSSTERITEVVVKGTTTAEASSATYKDPTCSKAMVRLFREGLCRFVTSVSLICCMLHAGLCCIAR